MSEQISSQQWLKDLYCDGVNFEQLAVSDADIDSFLESVGNPTYHLAFSHLLPLHGLFQGDARDALAENKADDVANTGAWERWTSQ